MNKIGWRNYIIMTISRWLGYNTAIMITLIPEAGKGGLEPSTDFKELFINLSTKFDDK